MARKRRQALRCHGHKVVRREDYIAARSMPTQVEEEVSDSESMPKIMPKEMGDRIKGKDRLTLREGKRCTLISVSVTQYWPLGSTGVGRLGVVIPLLTILMLTPGGFVWV